MIAGIVLGMGMPTTPAYIIMTALLVPAIIKLGVIPPAAHMFAFYFAVLSAITPPVALAVFAAAGHRQGRPVGERLGRGEDRRGRLHRAVHVRLRAGAADDRQLAADHRRLRHRELRHPAVRRRPARLFPHRDDAVAARRADRRRAVADRSGPGHRHHRRGHCRHRDRLAGAWPGAPRQRVRSRRPDRVPTLALSGLRPRHRATGCSIARTIATSCAARNAASAAPTRPASIRRATTPETISRAATPTAMPITSAPSRCCAANSARPWI